MSQLLPDPMKTILSSDHTSRHQPGWWNAIWYYMMIEKTVMTFDHGPYGVIGIISNEKALESWALSLHATTQLEQDFLISRKAGPYLQHHTKKKGKLE